jgi:hypothetical protein
MIFHYHRQVSVKMVKIVASAPLKRVIGRFLNLLSTGTVISQKKVKSLKLSKTTSSYSKILKTISSRTKSTD